MNTGICAGAGEVSSIRVPTVAPAAVCAPAGVTLKRLSQASGLRPGDRLLVTGILRAESLVALGATGASTVTLVRPDRLYPNPERADVVWVLGIDREEALDRPLKTALRCLAPGSRLLIELCTVEAADAAAAIATHLRRRGIGTVRVEPLRSGIVLVRGCVPAPQRRAA